MKEVDKFFDEVMPIYAVAVIVGCILMGLALGCGAIGALIWRAFQ